FVRDASERVRPSAWRDEEIPGAGHGRFPGDLERHLAGDQIESLRPRMEVGRRARVPRHDVLHQGPGPAGPRRAGDEPQFVPAGAPQRFCLVATDNDRRFGHVTFLAPRTVMLYDYVSYTMTCHTVCQHIQSHFPHGMRI